MKKKGIIFIFLFLLSVNVVTAFNFETGGVKIIEPVESEGGAVSVAIQDQTTPPIDLYFFQVTGVPTTIAENTSIGDVNVTLTSVTGIITGTYLAMFSGGSGENRFYFGEVLAVVGNNITLDTPLDFAYETGDVVIKATRDLNVDGSSTTQIFAVSGAGTGSTLEIDITRIIFQITDNTAMDDGTFGGISALTRGIVLRINNGITSNIYNIKSNGDFGLVAFDKTYSDKAPAGTFGLTVRSTFAGQNKHGVAIRLKENEKLELLIQDDLTGITSFRMLAQGHIVTN